MSGSVSGSQACVVALSASSLRSAAWEEIARWIRVHFVGHSRPFAAATSQSCAKRILALPAVGMADKVDRRSMAVTTADPSAPLRLCALTSLR